MAASNMKYLQFLMALLQRREGSGDVHVHLHDVATPPAPDRRDGEIPVAGRYQPMPG